MKPPALRISVVMCAYTEFRWHDMLAALESVQVQILPPFEIILVIDHNPRLMGRARAQFPDLKVVPNNEERGLSGARNSGVGAARGAVIAFMDEDAVAAPDWLAKLAAAYSEDRIVGVGGAIVPFWVDRQPRWFPEEFNWVVGCTYRGMPKETAPVRNLIGCNMSFRREVFERAGLFRAGIGRVGNLPVGCEETEICIRLHQRWPEAVLIYEPSALVRHLVPGERGSWSYFRRRCYSEGLSKATVARWVGAQDGLSNERAYTFYTLPLGVLRGLLGPLRLDLAGPARAVAIVAGLGFTTRGYLEGKKIQQSTATTTDKGERSDIAAPLALQAIAGEVQEAWHNE